MTKDYKHYTQTISRLGSWGVALILVLLPFHALFTTWLGSEFGSLDAFKAWKELLTLLLGLLAIGVLFFDSRLRKSLMLNFLFQTIALYVLYSLLRGGNGYLSGNVTGEALLFGIIANFRFLAFFLVAFVFAGGSKFLYDNWLKLLVGPAVLVVLFGLAQQFLLDKDFLKNFGYSKQTIQPFIAVDNKPEYIRLQSTFRGPNPLGAYLALVITTLSALFLARKQQLAVASLGLFSLLAMFFSYSRSAWIGLAVSILVLFFISDISKRLRQLFLVAMLGGVLVFGVGILLFQDNNYIQNTVFHSDENSTSSQSSNAQRTGALSTGLQESVREPLGRGLGTAGPASARNNGEVRIAENYYIQLAQEVGIIGLLMFLAICAMAAKELWWRRKNQMLARVLLASLAGISVINLVSHAWAYDVLSMMWWGLTGISLAQPVILTAKHEQKKKQSKEKRAR